MGGKLVRCKLKTDVYSKALLKLGDFLKKQRSKPQRSENAPDHLCRSPAPLWQALEARHDLKIRTKEYRLGCVAVLLKTWPGSSWP